MVKNAQALRLYGQWLIVLPSSTPELVIETEEAADRNRKFDTWC